MYDGDFKLMATYFGAPFGVSLPSCPGLCIIGKIRRRRRSKGRKKKARKE